MINAPKPGIWRALILGTLPFLVTTLLVFGLFGTRSFVPNGTDEIDYYLEILGVHHHGLNIGYYTTNEQTALVAFRHFGSHGPVYPILYGILSVLTGWTFQTAYLLNCLVLGLGIAIFDRLVNLQGRDFWLFLATVLTFYPLWLLTPGVNGEPLNLALSMMLGALLVILYRQELTVPMKVAYFSLMLLCITLRPTFAIFFVVPMLRFRWKDNLLAITLIAFGIAFDFLCWGGFTRIVASSNEAVHSSSLATTLWSHATQQLSNLLLKHDATWIEVGLRYEALFVFCGCIYLWIRWRRSAEAAPEPPMLFHIANLGSILLSLLLLYDVFGLRDYRMIAPHLLISVLLMISVRRLQPVLWALLAFNVLLAYPFLRTYKYLHAAEYSRPATDIAQFSHAIAPYVQYHPERSGWDNTLLYVSGGYRDLRVLSGLPAGIGLSVSMVPEGLELPPHSRYILIEPSRLADWNGKVQFKPLLETPWGILGENLSIE